MHKFKTNQLCKHLWIAFGGTLISISGMQQSWAQSSTDTVFITGSGIKQSIDNQQALPVSIYSVDELRAIGVSSTEEVVGRITASQSSLGASQSIGAGTGGASLADMRGLGANKTLVLLNGRRLSFFGIGSDTVDLNSIPFAALERVEVLRDGASAIYGTDAVGGVINFITKRDYKGVNVATEFTRPSGDGGDSNRFNISAGKGSLKEDGYNFWISLDSKKQKSVSALDRIFARTGVIPEKGLDKTSGTTFPANFLYYRLSDGKLAQGNITAPGCAPPSSISQGGPGCRYDYSSAIDIIPETDNTNIMGKGSFRLGGDKLLTLEAVHSTNTTISRTAPDPVTGLKMPTNSPFFPTTFPDIDTSKGLSSIGWRMVPAGQRQNTAEAEANRVVADLTGSAEAWDYKAGVFYAESKVTDGPSDGYVNKAKIQAGIDSGLLNPFGTNSAAGLSYINDAKVRGTASTGKGTTRGADVRFNRELFALDGGQAAISLGAELRREGFSTDTNDDLVKSVPSLGRSPYHVSDVSRSITALSAETQLPVTKQLELQLAARYDRYSDFGSSFNPKVGFRFSASPEVVLRGSATTGFRAPSLDDMFGPTGVTYTSNTYDDPVLCPNGVPTANAVQSRDCGQQSQRMYGGNQNLKPEKSNSFSLGTAFQPAKNLLFTVDYWNIELTKKISAFPEQSVFSDPVKYANRITRCNQLSAAEAANYDRCDQAGSAAIAYINTLTDNVGDVRTNGLDFAGAWQTQTYLGQLVFNYDSTYVHSYKYQKEIGGEFVENVGMYKDATPVFKWKHNLTTTLTNGSMSYSLGMRYLSGYLDENLDPEFINKVPSYRVFDFGMNFSGVKNLVLGLAVRNVLNTKPPFSNQSSTFQVGYDPRYTDALGRAAVAKLSYKF